MHPSSAVQQRGKPPHRPLGRSIDRNSGPLHQTDQLWCHSSLGNVHDKRLSGLFPEFAQILRKSQGNPGNPGQGNNQKAVIRIAHGKQGLPVILYPHLTGQIDRIGNGIKRRKDLP